MAIGTVSGVALADQPPQVLEYSGHGRWHDISTSTAPQIIPDPFLDQVEQLIDAHQIKAAHKLLSPWLKQNPNAADRDRALFLLAEIYFEQDDRITAFYHLDELMDKYPESRFFGVALQKQYEIADAFLNGYRRKFLGLHILSAEDEAVEMLYRIQERAPGSALAERCLLRTADYYFNTSQFDLAGDAYAAFAREFPRSPDVPYVKLRIAFSSLAQFRGVRYDATPLLDARAQFQEVIDKYPDLATQENVPERIDRIDRTLAEKLFITADFYMRTGYPGASVYVYRYLLQTYPNSPYSAGARRALARIPAKYLNEPPPPSPLPQQ